MATLLHRQKPLVTNLILADTFWRRSVGLMGKRELGAGTGLLLRPCGSIHTCFMRFPLDLIFLNAHNQITKIVLNIKPWRMVWGGWSAHSVIEFQSGWLDLMPAIGETVEIIDGKMLIMAERPIG